VQSERDGYIQGQNARENKTVTHAGKKVNLVSAFQFMLNLSYTSVKLRDIKKM
jgi:hypothetical protein